MSVLCVNLNAAIDKRYDLAAIAIGRVQRVHRVHATAGGKGLNAARGSLRCGQQVTVTGFVGGFAGEFIAVEVERLGIGDAFVRVQGESRTCINVIDADGASTEFLEPGVAVTQADIDALLLRYRELLPHTGAVTISGSLPAGCPEDLYAQLVTAARRAGVPVVVDTSGRSLAATLPAAPNVVKPNRDELVAHVGRPLDSLGDIVAAANALRSEGPEWVVVSLGAAGAAAIGPGADVLVSAPPVVVQNPVGCGDVLVGVLASGLADGDGLEASLARAVRLSAASAAHPETGELDLELAAGLATTTTPLEGLKP
jgi:tagatose 6-phosphate kinase